MDPRLNGTLAWDPGLPDIQCMARKRNGAIAGIANQMIEK